MLTFCPRDTDRNQRSRVLLYDPKKYFVTEKTKENAMWKAHPPKYCLKDVRVHAPITWIKLEIPIYFTDYSEFITDQFKKILSKAIKNEIKRFDFGSIKRKLTPYLRTIIAR